MITIISMSVDRRPSTKSIHVHVTFRWIAVARPSAFRNIQMIAGLFLWHITGGYLPYKQICVRYKQRCVRYNQ